MARQVFLSYDFIEDNWRATQVRNTGMIEANKPLSHTAWGELIEKGDKEIENWIDDQLKEPCCTVVLIGEKTADRKWIQYEIKKSWELGKGIVGIKIHNLKDGKDNQSNEGKNPFDDIIIDGKKLSEIVKVYNPPHMMSINVYKNIADNISDWVEEAISSRDNY